MKSSDEFNQAAKAKPFPFGKLLRVASLTMVSSYLALSTLISFDQIAESRKGEKLTEDEMALTKDIFGREVNSKIVRKHFKDADPKTRAYVMLEDDRNIYFLGKENSSYDYANESRMSAYRTFIHEMTHIWQNQGQSLIHNIKDNCNTYSYLLDETSKFEDLCSEQQASAVANYAVIYLSQWRSKIDYEGDREQLKRVVEEQFPAAREARLKLEQESTPAQEPLIYAKQQSPAPLTLNS